MKPKAKSIEMTCSACPSQWEGETNCGREIYVRYRHGWLTVDVDDEEVFAVNFIHDNGSDGVMSTEQMMDMTKDVVDWSEVEVG